jgi:ABC-type antimicrobial peptide transport system permease subunit
MTRRFIIGFAIGLLVFIAINLLSAHLASDCGLPAVFGRDPCADDIASAGWPLHFYEEGGLAYRLEFNLRALLVDLVIGIILASLVGWFMTRRSKQDSK